MLRTRLLLVALLAAACGEDPADAPDAGGMPPGTFCFLVAGAETCVGAGDIAAMSTVTGGDVWFQVKGTVPTTVTDRYGAPVVTDREVTVFGQLPQGTPLPAVAEKVVISLPITGTCESVLAASPFGPCDWKPTQAVCQARAVYDPERARLWVHALDETGIEAWFEGDVSVELPADCCVHDRFLCDEKDPPRFSPAGPHVASGRLHAEF